MTLPPERLKVLAMVCKDNQAAMVFCEAFVQWVHWIDDLVDKDKLWLPRDVVTVNLNAALAFSDNAFFQQHKPQLMPLIIQAFRAYGDSNYFEKRQEVRDRRAADILKSTYHEVVWHVAYICGGWEHLTEVTKRCRIFDYDFQG